MVGPRVVFERPRFSKWGVRVSMSILVGVALWVALSSGELMGRVILGAFALFSSPFLLLVWFRVAQRIEIDGDGVTIAGRLGARRYTWADVGDDRVRYPTYNWNDDEIVTPPELAGVEPAFELQPPIMGHGTPLQAAAYSSYRGRYIFRLRDALLFARGTDPDGDWRRQAAAVFAARDRNGFGPKRSQSVPTARANVKRESVTK